MQCRIPAEMREQLADDPFMRDCIVLGDNCEGRVERNHAFTYAGKRQNAVWAILPMCHFHHEKEAQMRTLINAAMRSRMWAFNAVQNFMAKYPKSTLI
jgi:hypothetical protein